MDGGATWTVLDSQTGVSWTSASSNVYAVANQNTYSSYRFTALASKSVDIAPVGLGELIFLGGYLGETDSLLVGGHPDPLGTVSPGYGTTNGLAQNDTVACSVAGPVVVGETLYGCMGHVLETFDGGEWVNPVTNSATSFTYTHGAASARLTWLWEPIAYKLTAAPANGTETVSFSIPPDVGDHYSIGSEVTLTANPSTMPPTSVFVRWHGDVPPGQETANPLTVVMDRSRNITPEFKRHWEYTDGAPAAITDGNWTLNVYADGAAGAIKIGNGTAVSIVSGFGKLDLSNVEADLGRSVRVNDRAFYRSDTVTDLVYPANAVKTGSIVCYMSPSLKSVTLPSTMEQIEANAFFGCTALTTIEPFLPASVMSIGLSAFEGCTALEGALVLESEDLKTIGPRSFYKTKTTSIRFPQSLESIQEIAFYTCTSLTNVVFEGNSALKSIGVSSFAFCSALETIEPFFPAGLETIGNNSFESCTSLKGSLVLESENLTSTGARSFYGTKITSISFPESLEIVGNVTFAHCTALTNVVYNGTPSLKTVDYGCFFNCQNLRRMEPFLPASVTSIGEQAFKDAGVEGRLTISNPAVTVIPNSAFYTSIAYARITDIVLPPNLEQIEYLALYNTANLTNVLFTGSPPTSMTSPLGVANAPTEYGLTIQVHYVEDPAGWDAVTTPLTEAEKAIAPPRCFGTWAFPLDATKTRKYWLVDWNPGRKATMIVIR